jgi:dCMP deaminase
MEESILYSIDKPSWDKTFFDIIDVIAQRSDDPNTKLGSIISSPTNDIISMGYNGLPRGIKPESHKVNRPTKYCYMGHAEENAILNCLRNGSSIPPSSRLYVQMVPCVVCTRMIIQSGIHEVVIGNVKSSNPKWREDWKTSRDMLEEAGVLWRFWFDVHKIISNENEYMIHVEIDGQTYEISIRQAIHYQKQYDKEEIDLSDKDLLLRYVNFHNANLVSTFTSR